MRVSPPAVTGSTSFAIVRFLLGVAEAGFGASGRFNRLDDVAIAYAFALWAMGLAHKAEV